jgi:ribosomal protein S18 acetylase RimI-like enzyme
VSDVCLIEGPTSHAQVDCEAILRSVPQWFGIEEALLEYVANTAVYPTFVIREAGEVLGFVSLREHFPSAWEIDCIAVHAKARNRGYGRILLAHAEEWLSSQGVKLLQVKTIAATSPNKPYAETRKFYESVGFVSMEIFPLLWAERNPCLQMVKVLR